MATSEEANSKCGDSQAQSKRVFAAAHFGAVRGASDIYEEGELVLDRFASRSAPVPKEKARARPAKLADLETLKQESMEPNDDAGDSTQGYKENVRTFLLCRVRAGRRSAFGRVPDAVCRLIAATAGCLFIAANAYRGRREGMNFKLGGQGLGYYPDYNALEDAARVREVIAGAYASERWWITSYRPPQLDALPLAAQWQDV